MSPKGKTRPLTTAGVHILVTLSGGPLHGYGIIKEIERLFGQDQKIGPGTLYDNLPRLINDGFVQEAKPAKGDSRRTYELTQEGAAALSVELEQMAVLLKEGRKRLRRLQEQEGV